MDLHLLTAAPSAAERAAVDEALGSVGTPAPGAGRVAREGLHEVHQRRRLLLPALHLVQKRIGWISEGALNEICRRLQVPPAEAYGVASFYAMFSTVRQPPRVAHVCDDIACKLAGADALCRSLVSALGPEGTACANGQGTWRRSPCLGLCARAPAALFQLAGDADDGTIAPASAADIERVLSGSPVATPRANSIPQIEENRDPALRLLRRVGIAGPESLSDYRAAGGYAALKRALTLGPAGVLREIGDSRLQGRGGAAFPIGRKWDAVASAPVRPHYVVCNADESEPGTFKDRVLIEEDPFAVIEAVTIAGCVVGAERGFVYVRGEYPLAARRLERAITTARAHGLLGSDIMGGGVRFDIELCRGAGAYICGEETALFNSIEGYRGEPRNKPPFPTDAGLFGKPTAVNNVETLVNVLDIVLEGGPAFAAIGTSGSTGSKLYCVSGAVVRSGLYEVAFGTTLRQLLDRAGGVRADRAVRTILLGGAAGSFVSPAELDVPLTFEGTRAIGGSLGSGVVMVFDDTADLTGIVLRIAAFFRDESCGQCVPCRVGTVRQEELLQRLARGTPRPSVEAEAALLDELAAVMRDASICGLGQTAANAVQSALQLGLL